MKAYTKSLLHLHFIIFIWGFTAVLGALIQLDYLTLTWYRMGIASMLLFIYSIFKKNIRQQIFLLDIKTQLRFILGGIIIALHWLAFFYAIKISNVSITLVALSSGAFFTSLLEPFFYKRKIYFHEIILGFLILIALMVLLKIEKLHFVSVFYALIAAFLSGLFSVSNGILIRTQSGVQLSFFQLFYGFLFLTIILIVPSGLRSLPIPTLNDWIYLFILASICTAYAFTVSISLLKYISPYTVMLSINLEPVYGIILAVLILGEQKNMSVNFYLGSFIILIIILLNEYIKVKLKKNTDKKLKL